jgi:hypothetical protein
MEINSRMLFSLAKEFPFCMKIADATKTGSLPVWYKICLPPSWPPLPRCSVNLKASQQSESVHFATLGYLPFGDIKGGGAAEMRSISDGPALVSEVCQTGQSRSDRCCKILFRLMFSRRVCPMSISCPSCSSHRIHRSRRKGFLESGPLTLMFVRPFRCEQCDHRFFRLSFSANPGVSPPGRTWLPLVRGR